MKMKVLLKIHAPKETLERGAEVIGMRAPVREFIVTYYSSSSVGLGGGGGSGGGAVRSILVLKLFYSRGIKLFIDLHFDKGE